MFWDLLLGAALEAGLSLLAEAGFGDEVRDLKARWLNTDEYRRRQAFEEAFARAREAAGEESLKPLLEHRPFQEEIISSLLDPVNGPDLGVAAEAWGERLPEHARALRQFFGVLENTLLKDGIWGPILGRYQDLRFRRDVQKALQERSLALSGRELVQRLNARLIGSEAMVQVGGNVQQIVQVFIQELTLAHPLPADAASLRRRYLRELAREANLLPWGTVNIAYADPARGEDLRLADIYTDLDTTELRHVEREEELRQFLAHMREAERVPAQEIANREPRLLIMGDPGSGKSTFVKHLAYVLAQAGLAEDPMPWLKRLSPWGHGALLPVWVELRSLAAFVGERTRRGSAALLLNYLRHMLGVWELEDFWPELDRALRDEEQPEGRRQPLLILLDGLDEIPTAQRQMVVDTVNAFSDRYGAHRYLVTCRPYAYVGQPWRLHSFHEVTLAPFSQEQIDRFVQNWYERLAERGRFHRQEVTERTARLQQAVRRPDLRGLAERPLLLTVMAQLHTFQGQLPDDRTQLYADAVNLLMQRWESRGGTETGILERLGIPGLKLSDLEAGLYKVAFQAHAGQAGGETADIDEADLRQWLAPYLGGDWNKAGVFVDYIRERAGLLIRHKTEAYTFPHRTFQEFLAACYLTGLRDYLGEAARLACQEMDRWREVFMLAAGHAARTHRLGAAIAAVNALCPLDVTLATPTGRREWQAAQLAGEALLEIGLVGVQREAAGQVLLSRVCGWLAAALRQPVLPALDGRPGWPLCLSGTGLAGTGDKALAARERATAGDTLAHLGDPRFCPDAWHLPDEPMLGFVEISAGSFLMGTRPEDIPGLLERFGGNRKWYEWEVPQHEVMLPAYYIARYLVTNAQYAAFVEADGYKEQRYWEEARKAGFWQNGKVKRSYVDIEEGKPAVREEWGEAPHDFGEPYNLSNHPVVGVTWYEALAYCRWLAERLREWASERVDLVLTSESVDESDQGARAFWEALKGGRVRVTLPSEAEWEKAARGTDGRIYPWGDDPDPNRANYSDTGIGSTSVVGCFPRGVSPYGCEDMSGNVWEWCATKWQDNYEGYKDDNRPEGAAPRVLRGGSFHPDERLVRCASRYGHLPHLRNVDLGFRVVASPHS